MTPLPDSVKNKVEQLGRRCGIKKLKFAKKSGETLPELDLVPGVDCDMLDNGETEEIQEEQPPDEPNLGENAFAG